MCLRRLRRAQLTLWLQALIAFGAVFGVLPIAIYLLPHLQHVKLPGVPVTIWVLIVPLCLSSWPSAGSMPVGPTGSTRPSGTWSSDDRAAVAVRRVHFRVAAVGMRGFGLRIADEDRLDPAGEPASGTSFKFVGLCRYLACCPEVLVDLFGEDGGWRWVSSSRYRC
ncbi:MAG: hypothetical protein ACYC91_14580, partial [Solirubrobacteraceae bacterium]